MRSARAFALAFTCVTLAAGRNALADFCSGPQNADARATLEKRRSGIAARPSGWGSTILPRRCVTGEVHGSSWTRSRRRRRASPREQPCAPQIMIHLARTGDVEDPATSLFREARELATRSGDPHVLALNGLGYLQLFAGGVSEGLDPLLESMRRADDTDDKGLRAAVRFGLSNAYFWCGRLRECHDVCSGKYEAKATQA
jgi:hypothetical protein